jgi:hypothetical protein
VARESSRFLSSLPVTQALHSKLDAPVWKIPPALDFSQICLTWIGQKFPSGPYACFRRCEPESLADKPFLSAGDTAREIAGSAHLFPQSAIVAQNCADVRIQNAVKRRSFPTSLVTVTISVFAASSSLPTTTPNAKARTRPFDCRDFRAAFAAIFR